MITEEIIKLHKKYASNDDDFEAVYTHCQIVAEIAEWCVGNINEKVDVELLKTAALLHDIGSYPFLAAWEVRDDYRKFYALHAFLGSKILEDEGYDKKICTMVQNHVLMGLTKDEINKIDFRMPVINLEADSIEGRLLCYADRFHSKKPVFNSFKNFHNNLTKTLPKQADKFMNWSTEFGLPDIEALAKKYNHPIR